MKILDISWDSDLFEKSPKISFKAVEKFKIKKDKFIYDILGGFERLSVNIMLIRDILNDTYGYENSKDVLKVKAFANAIDYVTSKNWSFSKKFFKEIHKIVSGTEIPENEKGSFRKTNVNISGVNYRPSDHAKLEQRWNLGIKFLKKIKNPLEMACAVFVWISRTQFFTDCNKRTAFLVMNNILVTNNIAPFSIPLSDKDRFLYELIHFYETGDATDVMFLLKDYHEKEYLI